MPTTIQIHERTLEILKKIKKDTHSPSYDVAITKIAVASAKKGSAYGFLGKKSKNWILKDLRDKHDRF